MVLIDNGDYCAPVASLGILALFCNWETRFIILSVSQLLLPDNCFETHHTCISNEYKRALFPTTVDCIYLNGNPTASLRTV